MRTLSSLAWGNVAAYVTSEHNQYNGLDLYEYTQQYCMDGIGHPGLDISLACGTTLYAIADGVVTCAGTGVGSGSDATVCGFFENDTCAPGTGSGRVQLEMDDDNYLIYGHCAQSLVVAGTTVAKGDPIAKSGGAGTGAHVHLEQRKRNSGCLSGWQIIDPEPLLKETDPLPIHGDWSLGDVLQVTSGLYLRDEAPDGSVITTMPVGTRAIVMNQYGPTYYDPHYWYKILTRYGRGWAAATFMDLAGSIGNLIANPTANTDLTKIVPNRSATALSRVNVDNSFRVLVDTLGTTVTGEGVRYETNHSLSMHNQRYFGGVINQVTAADSITEGKLLDFVRIAAYFTDGTTKYSSPVQLTVTDGWKGVVSALLDVAPGKEIDWMSLQVAVDAPIPLKFYTDNALLIEL